MNVVYSKGSVFKATSTHCRKTIEPPKDQPILSPSEESTFSQASSSSASREVPQVSLATTSENDGAQNSHPLVFNIHTEDQTSLATDQPTSRECTTQYHVFNKEEKGMIAST